MKHKERKHKSHEEQQGSRMSRVCMHMQIHRHIHICICKCVFYVLSMDAAAVCIHALSMDAAAVVDIGDVDWVPFQPECCCADFKRIPTEAMTGKK